MRQLILQLLTFSPGFKAGTSDEFDVKFVNVVWRSLRCCFIKSFQSLVSGSNVGRHVAKCLRSLLRNQSKNSN